jgi:porphobilinogen deaminase
MALTELRIASRRSQLAMVQTNWVKAELEKAHPGLTVKVEAMATKGDKILDVALGQNWRQGAVHERTRSPNACWACGYRCSFLKRPADQSP